MTESIDNIYEYANAVADIWCDHVVEKAWDEFGMESQPDEIAIKKAIDSTPVVPFVEEINRDNEELIYNLVSEGDSRITEEYAMDTAWDNIKYVFGDDLYDLVPYLMGCAKEYIDERNNHEN